MLKTGILFVDNVQLTLPPHDLAISTTLFDGRSDFHRFLFLIPGYPGYIFYLFIPEYYPSPAQVVWAHFHAYLVAGQDPYIVHSHFA